MAIVVSVKGDGIDSARLTLMGEDRLSRVATTSDEIVVFTLGDSEMEVPEGIAPDALLSRLAIRAPSAAAPAGSCGACTSEAVSAPQIFVPGDACPPPKSSPVHLADRSREHLDPAELDRVEAIRQAIILDWPGPCANRAPARVVPPGRREVIPLLPRTDFWPVEKIAATPTGEIGAFGPQVASVSNLETGERVATVANDLGCSESPEPLFPGSVTGVIGLRDGFVVAAYDEQEGTRFIRLSPGLEKEWVTDPLQVGESELISLPNPRYVAFIGAGKKPARIGRTGALDLCIVGESGLDCHNLLFSSILGNQRVFSPTLLDNGALVADFAPGLLYFSGIPWASEARQLEILRSTPASYHGTLTDGHSVEAWHYDIDPARWPAGTTKALAAIGDRLFVCRSEARHVLYTAVVEPARMRSDPSFHPVLTESATVSGCLGMFHSEDLLLLATPTEWLELSAASERPVGYRPPPPPGMTGLGREIPGPAWVSWDGSGSPYFRDETGTFVRFYGGPSSPAIRSLARTDQADFVLDRAGTIFKIVSSRIESLGKVSELGDGALSWDRQTEQLNLLTTTHRFSVDLESGKPTEVGPLSPALSSAIVHLRAAGRDTFLGLDRDGRLVRVRGLDSELVRIEAPDAWPMDAETFEECYQSFGITGSMRVLEVFGGTAWIAGCAGLLLRMDVFAPNPVAEEVSLPDGLTLSDSGDPRPLAIDSMRALSPNRIVLAARGYVIEARYDREAKKLVDVRHLVEEVRVAAAVALTGADSELSVLRSEAGGAALELGGPETIRLGNDPGVVSSVGNHILIGTNSGRLLEVTPCE